MYSDFADSDGCSRHTCAGSHFYTTIRLVHSPQSVAEFYWYVSENDNDLALRCYTELRGDLGSEVLLEDYRSLLWQYLKP